MTELIKDTKIYVIVHGNRQISDKVKSLLIKNKINKNNITMASMEKAGEIGEYVAMTWPPMGSKDIIVSEIIRTNGHGPGMGAWESIEQKELFRIPL